MLCQNEPNVFLQVKFLLSIFALALANQSINNPRGGVGRNHLSHLEKDMRKENQEVQYIWHDGVRIREDQLINMAMSAGSFAVAEHYICSLLAHGVIHSLAYYIDKVNEIREFYQVRQIPVPNKDVDAIISCNCISIEDKIRKKYRRMTIEERQELLRASLSAMTANHPKLFKQKKQWQGIYLVVRDRLDGSLNRTNFVTFMDEATPAGWPEGLKVSWGAIKNMSRDFHCADFGLLTYYELDYNPHAELCETFWEVVKTLIMADSE